MLFHESFRSLEIKSGLMKGIVTIPFTLASSSITLMSFSVYLDTMTLPHRALTTIKQDFLYHLDSDIPPIHNANSWDY